MPPNALTLLFFALFSGIGPVTARPIEYGKKDLNLKRLVGSTSYS